MRQPHLFRTLALLGALLVPATGARAGVVIDMEFVRMEAGSGPAGKTASGADGERRERETSGRLYVDGRQVKMQGDLSSPDRSSASVLYRPEPAAILVLDERDRSYVELDRTQARGISEQMAGARAEMQKALEGMRPEDRARAEKAIAQMGGAFANRSAGGAAAKAPERIEATANGKSDEVSGFSCREFEISRGSAKLGTACVAAWSEIGVDAADLAGLRQFAAFQREMIGQMGLGSAEALGTEAYEVMDQVGGLPVRTRLGDGSSGVVLTRVVAIERKEIEDAVFEVPAGYTKRATLPRPRR